MLCLGGEWSSVDETALAELCACDSLKDAKMIQQTVTVIFK